MRNLFFAVVCCLVSFWTAAAAHSADTVIKVKIGYFPNITHAHALIAQNMAAEGKGWFEERIPGLRLEWSAFNAGPSAMEALFAKSVDMTYVGPNPALNAHIRSGGKEVRVVSGAVRGGAALVVPAESELKVPADFKGKRVLTPQLGNTQDIACRDWFLRAGLEVTMTGGDVAIVPTPNSGMLGLFTMRRVDAAWTVEPWVSRLEREGNGRILYAEPAEESVVTILASSADFFENRRDVLKAFAEAHAALTEWIRQNPEEAQKRVAAELKRLTKREFPLDLVVHAWPRLIFDSGITPENFSFSLKAAQHAGFLKGTHDISKLVVGP